MADMLTYLCSQLFQSIRIGSEIINTKFKPGLDKLTRRFNALSDFVKETVLIARQPNIAIKRFLFWTSVTLRCMKVLNNFNDALSIFAALQSNVLQRLKGVMKVVNNSPEWLQLHCESRAVFDTRYRQKYMTFVEAANRPVIPYPGVYLTEAVYIDEMPDRLKSEPTAVNFEKRRILSHLIKTLNGFIETCHYPGLVQKFSTDPNREDVWALARHLDGHVGPSGAQLVCMSYETEPDPSDVAKVEQQMQRRHRPTLKDLMSPSIMLGNMEVQMSVQEIVRQLLTSEGKYLKELAAFKAFSELCTKEADDEDFEKIIQSGLALLELHTHLFARANTTGYRLDSVCNLFKEYVSLHPHYSEWIKEYWNMAETVEDKYRDAAVRVRYLAIRRSLPPNYQLTLNELVAVPLKRMPRYFKWVDELVTAAGSDVPQIKELRGMSAVAQAQIAMSSQAREMTMMRSKLFGAETPCVLHDQLDKRARDGTFKSRNFGLFQDKLVYKSTKSTIEMKIDDFIHVEFVPNSDLNFYIYHTATSFEVRASNAATASAWVSQLSQACSKSIASITGVTSAPLLAPPSKYCSGCQRTTWTTLQQRCNRCGAAICMSCSRKDDNKCPPTCQSDCNGRRAVSCKTRPVDLSVTPTLTNTPPRRGSTVSRLDRGSTFDDSMMEANLNDDEDREPGVDAFVSEVKQRNYEGLLQALGLQQQPDKSALLRGVLEAMRMEMLGLCVPLDEA
eukprot:c13751_g1_i1.p1 GENE.c13751_g1_i1~~c13751_g1_i1.p1  ORF type:complete len:860 (+),score=203.13 c13751_g1_i1:388-2580(+)